MRIQIRLAAFPAVYFLLACTIMAVSAAVYEAPVTAVVPSATEAVKAATSDEAAPTQSEPEPTEPQPAFIPRLSAPGYDNACYYSDENIFYAADYGMPNCTCYAWGRAYELTGAYPDLSPYDACTWYDYNRQNAVYDYGDTPEEGAIACFAYADGGSGHVAVVEEVGEESLTLSNSAYSGTEFYLDTTPADDPTGGRENWIFQGYIYVNRK